MDRNLRWIGLAGIVRAAGLSLITPFFILYLRNVLGLGYVEIGLLAALVGILPLVLVPFAGLLADRVGRRRVFLVAVAGEALTIVLAAASMELRSLVGLMLCVTATACAGALAGPALSAYVADLSEGSQRTQAFTWLRVGWNVGFTAGVLSGGSLIGVFGFPQVGFGAGVVLAGGVVLLTLVLEPSQYDRDRAAGVPRGAMGRPGGMRETMRVLAHDRVFLAFCASVAIAQLAVGQWSPTLPLYANTVLGVPYSLIGVAFAINGVLVVVAQAPTTRAAIGHRHTSVLHLGIVLYAVGFLILTTIAVLPGLVLGVFFGAVIVLTMGENVLSIPLQTLPSNLAPATDIAAYNGAFFAIVGAGQILAPTLGGVVLAATTSPLWTWVILVTPVIPALLLSQLYVVPRIRATSNQA